jgi:hypothetical protein
MGPSTGQRRPGDSCVVASLDRKRLVAGACENGQNLQSTPNHEGRRKLISINALQFADPVQGTCGRLTGNHADS